jgi:putative PIN family toxin of toxin-antitoxin system
MKPRVVFDCMVFLQGAANASGPAAACLRLAEESHVQLCFSREVLEEVREVLSRPKLRQKFPSLTPEQVASFLDVLAREALLLEEVPAIVSLERDPKDEKYLNLAVASGAQALVSRDNDLLDLRAEANPLGKEIRARFPLLRIFDPVEFLRQRAQGQAVAPPQPESPPACGDKPSP